MVNVTELRIQEALLPTWFWMELEEEENLQIEKDSLCAKRTHQTKVDEETSE